MIIKKPKIEAIYPLSTIQQGYLFHHLMKRDDPGFLISQCVLEGSLDIKILQQAWKSVTLRHEVMRTSVHWKKIKRPVLLVRPEKEIQWSFLDWTGISIDQQDEQLEAYIKERRKVGVVFEDNPLSKICLIQKTTSSYFFLWECHHLLLDGLSAIIILRDAFTYYEGLASGSVRQLQPIPKFKSYSNWLKNISLEAASAFWSKTFQGFERASVFQQHNKQVSVSKTIAHVYSFTEQVSEDLKNLAKTYRITLNTLFQGIWAMALSRYFNTKDVTFGNTVSGRSVPFPYIELMAGMFANVLPVRLLLKSSNSFQSCLQLIQSQQQEARSYEYCKLDQISNWVNIPGNKNLFDSLFVFQNFPWDDIAIGSLRVSGYKSGLTTTYPMTAAFKIEDRIQYEILVNTTIIPKPVIDWFLEIVPSICNILLGKGDISIAMMLKKLPVYSGELP
jgi:hypothetical protein